MPSFIFLLVTTECIYKISTILTYINYCSFAKTTCILWCPAPCVDTDVASPAMAAGQSEHGVLYTSHLSIYDPLVRGTNWVNKLTWQADINSWLSNMNFGPQTTSNWRWVFTHPPLILHSTSLPGFADGDQQSGTQPNFVKWWTHGR